MKILAILLLFVPAAIIAEYMHAGPVVVFALSALAIVPLWLNIGFWYGWHPRHLLIGEAGFLGVHYAASGLVLSLSIARSSVSPPPEG